MKQKRKVKSLIPLRSDSSVLATILLFLGWGILLFWALALFTSLGWVASAAVEWSLQYDNWIDDKVEVLLWLEMATGATSANMYFNGNTFYVEENQWISRDESYWGTISGYVNYLWWEWMWTNIDSNNITVIWWKNVKVFENNANTTILWWVGNTVDKRDTEWVVATVMLWWEGNIIGKNQEGSAIVWWKGNKISDGGQYDFIIWWENNEVNWSNVIVWWGKVNVEGKSNVFVFSHGQTSNRFKPQSENAFYLNLRRGLWLNKDAVNEWVDSYWAVGFWEVNINILCTNADLWVQWNWQGCLVWCTQASMSSGYRWEMVDHGDTCERYCKNNEDRCMVNPIKIEKPDDYTSYCTVGWVDTGNSTQCASNKLSAYENVIFETYLIDSNDQCPEGQENKCVFKCNKDFHLRVNTSSSNSNDRNTKKCYADCELPWKTSTGGIIMVPHNTTTGAYNAEVVNCSNDAYRFPESTFIINKPSTVWVASKISGGKVKSQYWKSAETCAGKGWNTSANPDYEHYKTLVCYDGTLYIADTNGRKTSKVALGWAGEWYGYNTCELKEYRCNTGTYNLDQNFIRNIANDSVTNWKKGQDRVQISWRRWVYEVCLDWFPGSTNAVCNKWTVADNYHYKLVKCQTHFSKWKDPTVSQYACMESCSLTWSDGKAHWYDHYTIMTWYRNSSELCWEDGKGSCQPHVITCNDWKWVLWDTKYGQETNDYWYDDCTLNKYECAWAFDIKKSDKENREAAYPGSKYDWCTPYSAKNGNKFQCTSDENKYDLVDCDDWYHTEQWTSSRNKYCISNNKTVDCSNNKPVHSEYYYWYNKYKRECPYARCWNVWEWVHTEGSCSWYCLNGYHKETGSCVYNTKTVPCTGNPDNSHWVVGTARWEWDWSSWDDPNWRMRQEEFCDWDCDTKYEEVDGACVYVPDWCSSSACGSKSDGESCTTYKRCSDEEVVSTCTDGHWDVDPTSYASPNLSCSSCRGCPWRDHVSHGWKCESYDQCDDEKQTSRCTDGDWDVDPKDYSSPDQWCDNSCPAIWVCSGRENGWECKTYLKCSTESKTITCENWTWSDTPYDYSAPNMWCEPCNTWCPSGPVAHGWRCTSYSTDSSCDCSSVKQISRCSNWRWDYNPFEYGSCSAPASCGEWWCPATPHEYGDCSFEIPAMSHWWSDTIETVTNNYDWSIAVSCNNTELSISDESCSKLVGCGTAPTNAEWVNGYYRKSWNGTAWTPTKGTPTYSSDSSVECSYQCKEHYRWNSIAKQCEPDRRQIDCENLPSNSTWAFGKFAQVWGGDDWTPSSHANKCVTSSSSTEECSFVCDSTHKCNNDWDACIIIDTNQRCDNTVVHKCTEWWTPTSTNDDDSAYRWDCKDQTGCYKCQNGYTDKGEWVCKISCGAGTYLPKNSITCSNCPCGYECPWGEFDKSTTEDQWKNKCASWKYSTAWSSSCDSCSSWNHPNSTQCGCEKDKKCTYQGQEYNPGAYINGIYSSSSVECPGNCYTTSATCRSDWTWDKEIYTSCTVVEPSWSCSSDFNLTSIPTTNVESYESCTKDYTVHSYSYWWQTYYNCEPHTKYQITKCVEGKVFNQNKTACVDPYIGYSVTVSEYCPTPWDMVYYGQNPQIIANWITYTPVFGGVFGCGYGETETFDFELPMEVLGKLASFRYERCNSYASCTWVWWDITIWY